MGSRRWFDLTASYIWYSCTRTKFKMKLLRNKNVANEYIKTVYQILLGREPDEDGLSNYSRVLEDSGVSGFAQILVSVLKAQNSRS